MIPRVAPTITLSASGLHPHPASPHQLGAVRHTLDGIARQALDVLVDGVEDVGGEWEERVLDLVGRGNPVASADQRTPNSAYPTTIPPKIKAITHRLLRRGNTQASPHYLRRGFEGSAATRERSRPRA